MAMETCLQQLKFFREQMNDHEDKVAWLSAEESEQQAHIRDLQKDLESVRDNVNRAKEEAEACSKVSGSISKLIVSCQKGLEALDTDCRTLSQAWELMNEDMRQQSSRVLERKFYFEKTEADARSQLHQFQAHYESFELKQEAVGSGASLGQATDKAPGVGKLENHETTVDDIEMVEVFDDEIGSEFRLQQLQEEFRQVQEEHKSLEVENDQLEEESGSLEEKIRALTEEKLVEEDFVQTLHDHLEKLKKYSKDVVCCSCKHSYVIELDGSKFVIRST